MTNQKDKWFTSHSISKKPWHLGYLVTRLYTHLWLCDGTNSLWMNLHNAMTDVWMDVTKCIVTKLQMLQTSPLAQIYLLTIQLDMPSTKNSAILAASGHLEFLITNIKKCCNFWTLWDIDSRLALFCSGLNSLELALHENLAAPHFSIHKMVGG
jgi:hypothetical protein